MYLVESGLVTPMGETLGAGGRVGGVFFCLSAGGSLPILSISMLTSLLSMHI